MTENTQARLLLVDGHSLLFRAHYAFFRNPLINSKGMNTSAVFGFMNMMLKAIEDVSASHVVVAFDTAGDTFRNELYAEYKGNRDECPVEITEQTPYAIELVKAMNLPVVTNPRYEADDLLGTLAVRFAEAGSHVTILTGDRDMLQLVRPHLTVMLTKSGVRETAIYDSEASVVETLGVVPEKVPDLKGLQGDSSDNIPGVPGVGPKTACKLLDAHHDLEGIYAALPEMKKSKMKERLEENKELAFLSRELGRIVTDVEVPLELDQAKRGPGNREALQDLTATLELRRIANLLGEEDVEASQADEEEPEYILVDSAEGLEAMCQELQDFPALAIDTETTSPHPMRAELVGISISGQARKAYYIPLAHIGPETQGTLFPSEGDDFAQLEKKVVFEALVPLAGPGSDKILVGQNFGYDYLVLKRAGFELGPMGFDTMVAAYVLDPGKRRYDLKSMAFEHLGLKMKTFAETVPKGSTFANLTPEEGLPYAACDADATLRLFLSFSPQLKEQGLEKLYREIELPLVQVLAQMEYSGIRLDPKILEELSAEFQVEMDQLVAKAHELAGREFNLKSPSQLSTILFEEMGYEPIKKTKSGFSTDADVLTQLEAFQDCKLAGVVHRHRHLAKLKGTYLDTLPKEIHPKTKRVHASFHQTVAATGRLSSSDPNLQNIPIRSDEGKRIRTAFLPAEGHVYLGADYSQIELRILAHMSQSKVLVEAFQKGLDVHRQTAEVVFSVPAEEVTSEQRNQAKTINFGLIYGQSAHGLAQQLLISRKEAQAFIETYFERLPEVKSFLEEIKTEAKAQGFVETMLGRRRQIPELSSKNPARRAFAERIAINTPIQGTAADLIKMAMLSVSRRLQAEGLSTQLILQIHDELILEAPEAEIEAATRLLQECMEEALELKVPLVATVSTGKSWAELK